MKATTQDTGITVLIVRHGQSSNNQLQLEVEEKMQRGQMTAEQATEEWMQKRVPDPALSDKGAREAEAVARYLAANFGGQGAVVASPMLRAIQTANPIVQAAGLLGIVSPLLHEVGGMYVKRGEEFTPAAGMSAAEIKKSFPDFDVSKLPKEGCWNAMRPKEQPEGYYERAKAAAAWVKSSEVRETVGKGPLVLVMHSDFIDLTIKALLCLPLGPPQAVFYTSNCSVTELFLPEKFCTETVGYGTLVCLNKSEHLPKP